MFARNVRALALVCGIAAAFSFGCAQDNTSADMKGDNAKCCKEDGKGMAKDGKCCGGCQMKDGAAKKDATAK